MFNPIREDTLAGRICAGSILLMILGLSLVMGGVAHDLVWLCAVGVGLYFVGTLAVLFVLFMARRLDPRA